MRHNAPRRPHTPTLTLCCPIWSHPPRSASAVDAAESFQRSFLLLPARDAHRVRDSRFSSDHLQRGTQLSGLVDALVLSPLCGLSLVLRSLIPDPHRAHLRHGIRSYDADAQEWTHLSPSFPFPPPVPQRRALALPPSSPHGYPHPRPTSHRCGAPGGVLLLRVCGDTVRFESPNSAHALAAASFPSHPLIPVLSPSFPRRSSRSLVPCRLTASPSPFPTSALVQRARAESSAHGTMRVLAPAPGANSV
ncbi:hypothetical protein B0H16DRAFT_1895611 [Mycena metata]|uniref:Uncharacterized protein n=1 Tax=Mycena metata TaxID=1033252 RepID=A0AAD7HFU6_9AGAR|nr:hypothetical protein B0H16DRAFT_1897041 [Mycena metata]KAJ7724132.1 hypothetical protein B0H16DRAFT_1895611 [Mycena metata]